jgi:hypothetical protein
MKEEESDECQLEENSYNQHGAWAFVIRFVIYKCN